MILSTFSCAYWSFVYLWRMSKFFVQFLIGLFFCCWVVRVLWKRLWRWEGLGAGGEGDDRGWDGWMASLTRWTGFWVNSGSWWWTGRPGVLWFMGSKRVGHDWATELNWTEEFFIYFENNILPFHGLTFHSVFWCTHILNFDRVQLTYFFRFLCFWCPIQQIIAKFIVIKFPPMCSSKHFIISTLTFRSLTHLS